MTYIIVFITDWILIVSINWTVIVFISGTEKWQVTLMSPEWLCYALHCLSLIIVECCTEWTLHACLQSSCRSNRVNKKVIHAEWMMGVIGRGHILELKKLKTSKNYKNDKTDLAAAYKNTGTAQCKFLGWGLIKGRNVWPWNFIYLLLNIHTTKMLMSHAHRFPHG